MQSDLHVPAYQIRRERGEELIISLHEDLSPQLRGKGHNEGAIVHL